MGGNLTILDKNVWRNATINDFIHDAEKALNVLITQPEVNSIKGITIIGHSEGTIIAPSANDDTNAPTSMSLFDQGLVQVLQASVTRLS